MVSVLKNEDGLIYGYAEWRLLNKYGMPFEPKDYIYVKHLWIHPKYRSSKTLSNLIHEIDNDPVGKHAKYVYWRNIKHNRISKTFKRDKAKTKGVKHVDTFDWIMAGNL